MEFSRQEYWSGLPFPSPKDPFNPGIEPGSLALRADSLPSEPPHISPLMCAKSLSLCDPMDTWGACHAALSMRFSRQEYWSGLHALLQGIFLTWESNPCLLCLLNWQVGSLPVLPPRKPPVGYYHLVIITLTVLSPDFSGNPRSCVTRGSDALLGVGWVGGWGSAFCLALPGQGLLRLLRCQRTATAKPDSQFPGRSQEPSGWKETGMSVLTWVLPPTFSALWGSHFIFQKLQFFRLKTFSKRM